MLERISWPTPATAISWLAVVIALGGTAAATTATLVNIADSTGTKIAFVDGAGRLKTTAAPSPGLSAFTSFSYAPTSAMAVLGPSQASVVVSSIGMSNPYLQTNGAPASVTLGIERTTNASCPNSVGKMIGAYSLHAGTSFQMVFPAGPVLKPKVAGESWRLMAYTSVQGNPGTVYNQIVSVNGYVESGSFTPPMANPGVAATSNGTRHP